MRGDKLKHGPSTETSQWIGCGVGFTLLGSIESLADVAPSLAGELTHFPSARSNPYDRPPGSFHYT